jgi:prolyl-tRNA synthetase
MEGATQAAKGAQKKGDKQIPVVGGKKEDSKEIIGMTVSKNHHFSQWYQELVMKGEMVEYYEVGNRFAYPETTRRS